MIFREGGSIAGWKVMKIHKSWFSKANQNLIKVFDRVRKDLQCTLYIAYCIMYNIVMFIYIVVPAQVDSGAA